MIGALGKEYWKNPTEDLDKYLTNILEYRSKNKNFNLMKIISLLEKGYKKAKIALKSEKNLIKDPNVLMHLKIYEENARNDRKTVELKMDMNIFEIYLIFLNVDGDEHCFTKNMY